MKMTASLVALLGLVSLSPITRAADTYTIDAAHSSVGFAISHMVINTVKGRFNEFSGTVMLDHNQIQEAKGTIQAKSIDTGVAGRDKHLRSADFFDVEKYPTITFQAKRVTGGAEPVLIGDFTMHGVTKQLSLPVTVKGPINDPMGNERIGLQAKTKLDRREYGLSWSKTTETGGLMVGHEVEIEINAEAFKAKAK